MTCTHEHDEAPVPADPAAPVPAPAPDQPDGDGEAGDPEAAWPEVLRVARPPALANPAVGR